MAGEKKILIQGKRIRLRTAVKDDMKMKVRWYNDPQVNKTLILPERLELDRTYRWFEQAEKDSSRRDWVIETLRGKPIGFVGIKQINTNNRSGLLYIVIGDKRYWGKGLGFESELLAVHYAFQKLGLHKVRGSALEINAASLALMKKVGFKQEGTLRDEYFKDGRFFDVHIFSILRSEFYRKHPELRRDDAVDR